MARQLNMTQGPFPLFVEPAAVRYSAFWKVSRLDFQGKRCAEPETCAPHHMLRAVVVDMFTKVSPANTAVYDVQSSQDLEDTSLSCIES